MKNTDICTNCELDYTEHCHYCQACNECVCEMGDLH